MSLDDNRLRHLWKCIRSSHCRSPAMTACFLSVSGKESKLKIRFLKNHPIYWSRWRFTNSHAGPEAAAMSAPRFLFHPKGYWVQEGDPRDEQQCSQAIHSFVLTGGVNTSEFINKKYLKTLPPKHWIWCCRCKTKVCVFNIYILTCWRTSQCET